MQDGLIHEAGCLFAKSMTKQPSYEDIGTYKTPTYVASNQITDFIIFHSKLGGRWEYKFNKAKTFLLNRLTDIRSEERRRVKKFSKHVE